MLAVVQIALQLRSLRQAHMVSHSALQPTSLRLMRTPAPFPTAPCSPGRSLGWVSPLQSHSPACLPCSADILADMGLPWVILGHSERRQLMHESEEVRLCQLEQAGLPVRWQCH